MTEEIIKLRAQREEITQKIAELEKTELEKASTFEKKLDIWANAEDGVHMHFIPSEREYPALRKYINDRELNRYQTYDLRDHFEYEIGCIIEDENLEDVSDTIRKALEEAVENNLHSFRMDW